MWCWSFDASVHAVMPLVTGRLWDAELSSFEGRDLDQWLRQATWRPGPRGGRCPRIFRSVDGRGFPSVWPGLSADCVPFCSVTVTDSLKAGVAVRGACGISFICLLNVAGPMPVAKASVSKCNTANSSLPPCLLPVFTV